MGRIQAASFRCPACGPVCLGKPGWQLRACGLCCMEGHCSCMASGELRASRVGCTQQLLALLPSLAAQVPFLTFQRFSQGWEATWTGLTSLLPLTICILPLGGKNFPRNGQNTLLAPEGALGRSSHTCCSWGWRRGRKPTGWCMWSTEHPEMQESHCLVLSTGCPGPLGGTEDAETPGCGTPMATGSSRPCSTPSSVLVLEGGRLDLAQRMH